MQRMQRKHNGRLIFEIRGCAITYVCSFSHDLSISLSILLHNQDYLYVVMTLRNHDALGATLACESLSKTGLTAFY